MKTIYLFLITLIVIGLSSCTQNEMAKSFGETATVNLPKGQKLVTATWKEQSLWYLTREMKSDEKAEQYLFQEEISYGLVEGKVIFIERK